MNSVLTNLSYSLNATMPVFIMMVVGFSLRKLKLLDEHSTSVINKLVFKLFLPALLFMDLASQDFVKVWDNKFVAFCAITTIISVFIAYLLSFFDKDKRDRGEFMQASYRSAAASLGIVFMTGIYDNLAMVALMIFGCAPLYNVFAAIILSATNPSREKNKNVVRDTFMSVVKNPIIIGILLGFVWSILKIPKPPIFAKSVNMLGNVASPLALIALGSSFEFKSFKEKLGPVIMISFNKLMLFCILFLPVAIWLGFRDEKLVAALIMLGSATTSSSFIMAKNMGHEGVITSSAVMVTTFLSSFTLTLWLFILKTLGYI